MAASYSCSNYDIHVSSSEVCMSTMNELNDYIYPAARADEDESESEEPSS